MTNTGSDAKVQATASYRYAVDIMGWNVAYFTEVSGINVECKGVDLVFADVANGGTGLYSYPGVVSYGDITLKKGTLNNGSAFFAWLQKVVDGKFSEALSQGTLYKLPHNGDRSTFTGNRWNLDNIWPSKWELAPSGVGENQIVIETLTLKVGELRLDPKATPDEIAGLA